MSKEERKVPELRFKGFYDDWEQRNISNIAILNPKSSLPETFKYIDLESVKDNRILSYKEERAHSAPSRAQRVASKGDIFFQTVRPYQKNNFLYNLNDNDYVFSTGYAQIRPFISSHFLLYRLLEDNFVNKVLRSSTGTSYPAINSQDLSKINFAIPIDEMEQEKIGALLNKLNNYIVLHQRKINTLETFKKVYLSVMFTNKNDNTPLLRFKNFTEAWEQRKFKNFVEDISTGRSSFISGKLQSNKNKFPILGSTNLIGYDSSYDYSGNFILTARVGANAGNIYRFQGDVKISDNTIYIQTKNLIFTYYLLLNFNLKRLAFGTGQPLIKASEIEKITFRLPSTAKEYRKIGQCLNNIDNLTTLHQRKLYTLKKLKQAYLNKMFI